ncbi:MAG: putative lipid II flippase FtsW [Pseudohongiellaceae bacterium]
MQAVMQQRFEDRPYYGDSWLIVLTLLLLFFGLIMMTSASIEIGENLYGDPFYHFKKQVVFIVMGLIGAAILLNIPMQWWERGSYVFYGLAILMLVSVLIPGIGHTAGGGTRWINLGFMTLQVSEPAKICIVFFMAGLLSRHHAFICGSLKGFLLPFACMALPVVLLLLEPDFGAVVVIMFAIMAMLFLAGARFWHFLLAACAVLAAGAGLIMSAEYRMRRVMSYLKALKDPFHEDIVFDSGYQLAQALIGFGRGEWLGMGLGNSIQKMYFLPDGHTDFIIAIIAEELGVIGVIALLFLFAAFITRALIIARRNERNGNFFMAYAAYGLAFIFIGQVVINVSVNIGLLPNKGLTLPFISSGGSSLLTCIAMVALLLRMDIENHYSGGRKAVYAA